MGSKLNYLGEHEKTKRTELPSRLIESSLSSQGFVVPGAAKAASDKMSSRRSGRNRSVPHHEYAGRMMRGSIPETGTECDVCRASLLYRRSMSVADGRGFLRMSPMYYQATQSGTLREGEEMTIKRRILAVATSSNGMRRRSTCSKLSINTTVTADKTDLSLKKRTRSSGSNIKSSGQRGSQRLVAVNARLNIGPQGEAVADGVYDYVVTVRTSRKSARLNQAS